MSYSDDPYASPQTDSAIPPSYGEPSYGPRDTIDTMQAFKFAFTGPNWFGNLMLVLVCALIPVIGPIVFLGYQMETVEFLLKNPGANCPKLDFGRFGELLKRGVWPFLGALIGQLVLLPLSLVLVIPFFCLFFGSIPLMENDSEGIGILLMLGAFLYLFLAIIVAHAIGMCIATPMMLGAGLACEVGPAFDFSFIKGFLARTWKEMFKAYLVFMIAGMFFPMLGCCALIVGLYVVMAWMGITMAHLYYQAYDLYLARGGKPIKRKAEFAG